MVGQLPLLHPPLSTAMPLISYVGMFGAIGYGFGAFLETRPESGMNVRGQV